MKKRAWPWPVALGLLTALGLVVALCGDGLWDAFAWIVLGAVLAVSLRHALRG